MFVPRVPCNQVGKKRGEKQKNREPDAIKYSIAALDPMLWRMFGSKGKSSQGQQSSMYVFVKIRK